MAGIKAELRRRTQERGADAATLRQVEVRRNVRIAPRFRRLTVGGEQLAGFGGGELPADAVKAFLPAPGERRPVLPTRVDTGRLLYPDGATPPAVRAYTVRRFDRDALELDLDVVLHDATPQAPCGRGPRHRATSSRWSARGTTSTPPRRPTGT